MSKGFTKKQYTNDFFEYEKYDKPISVVGRLRKRSAFWESIGASDYVLSVIRKGYVIPIKGEVKGVFLKNNRSSRSNPEFVQKSIDELLDTGAVRECDSPPMVVNPLTVSNKNNKLRLVIDMRHINNDLVKTKCKYEGIDTMLQYLEKDGFMTTFDLKSGYHHIDVVETQHGLMGFSFQDYTGKERYFHFTVLPFGLATAGLVFTKVLREIIKHWRNRMIKAVVFLDDGLQTHSKYNVAKKHALIMKGVLLTAGWIPHRTKSCWEPKQIVIWLGFVFDLIRGMIFSTDEKLSRTEKVIEEILKNDSTCENVVKNKWVVEFT